MGRVSDGVGGMTPGSACVLVVKGRRRGDGQFAFMTEDVFVLQVVQNKHGSRQQLRTLFPKKRFFSLANANSGPMKSSVEMFLLRFLPNRSRRCQKNMNNIFVNLANPNPGTMMTMVQFLF